MRSFAGQGATEYLVLLAVVLIIALVSIALLGFFPGTAMDSQIAESQIYWQSAYPFAIKDMGGAYHFRNINGNWGLMELHIVNNGQYSARLSKILGGGKEITAYENTIYPYTHNLTDIYLSPGESVCLAMNGLPAVPGTNCATGGFMVRLKTDYYSPGWSQTLNGADTLCNSDGTGMINVKDFGFEYTEYIEGQSIVKRQIGKPLALRCMGACIMSGGNYSCV